LKNPRVILESMIYFDDDLDKYANSLVLNLP